MNKNIVISSIGGCLQLDEEDSKWLYDHISPSLKDAIDKIMNNPKVAVTLPEAIDLFFGNLSTKQRCNRWLCRLVDEKKEKYPHLTVNIIPTDLFVIEIDRKGGEEFRSQNNYDWEQTAEWSID